jgi:hypothetical protein
VKRFALLALPAVLCLSPGLPVLQARAGAPSADDPKQLVYADFEKMENGRPVSARGGVIQLFAYEESGVHKSIFKGLEGANPPAPELVRIKKDDPNHAMKFDYSLRAPNQWAGVTVEIHGKPDVDGNFDPDDVSGYKVLSLQVYATGTDILKLEAVSKGSGKDLGTVHPLMNFRVKPQMNTYRVPLSGFTQPAWAKDVRIDPKDIFRKLTSINLTAFCDQCELNKEGMIIVDNMVFEK